MSDAASLSETVHGTTVSIDDRAALIVGPSGSGKSALALQLITLGATLVADDRTLVTLAHAGRLQAQAPATIKGMLEARHVGLLQLDHRHTATIALVVDLGQDETERLPPPRDYDLLGVTIPCLFRASGPHFPAAVLLCLKGSLPLRT